MTQIKSSVSLPLLGVAFVVLKLCGVIAWSWWWVTLPFWIGIPIVLFVVLMFVLVAIISPSKIKVTRK